MQYVIAFVTGGMICALSQILMEKTKMLPGRIMVLLVCLGAILGFAGIYEPFSKWAQAGANVPLLGFGNNLWKGVKEMVDKKGFIGIFLGGFKNCAVRSTRFFLYCLPALPAKDEKALANLENSVV